LVQVHCRFAPLVAEQARPQISCASTQAAKLIYEQRKGQNKHPVDGEATQVRSRHPIERRKALKGREKEEERGGGERAMCGGGDRRVEQVIISSFH